MILDLYIDTARRELVAGPLSSSVVPMPVLSQGNTVTLRIRALTPTANFPLGNPPYTLTAVAGKTLQLAIGTKLGSASTHYVEQYTWSAGTDLVDPYWYADVAMNTQAVSTLLGTSASKTAYLEINLVAGTPQTILSKQVTIEASVIKNDALTVPVGLTPASMEAVMALLKNLVANSITLQNETDPSKQTLLTTGDDGTFHADPLS
jgi:hypothetical protein